MPIPSQTKIKGPLLAELLKAGGSAKPKEIYTVLHNYFPDMSELDREEELNSGGNKFTNSVQWTRNQLCTEGLLDRAQRGVWILTTEGELAAKEWLDGKSYKKPDSYAVSKPNSFTGQQREHLTLVDLVEEHDLVIREQLIGRVLGMDPYEFEQLCGKLLRLMGFREVVVTSKSNDGGIDGHGKMRVGIVSVNASFQCKRYQPANKIGRPVIDQVRGAASGLFEQAIILTTSSFTSEAIDHSIRAGTIPVVLIDGTKLVDFMIEQELGVSTRSFQFPVIDEDFFAIEEER